MRRFAFKPALTLTGREFRGVRGFAGKPFHPPLTDIPIGAYVIAPVLDAISFFFGNRAWSVGTHRAAGYVYLIGAAVSLLTAVTGLFDWLDTERGTQMRRMANAHAWTMLAMTAVVIGLLGYRYLGYDATRSDALQVVLGGVVLALAVIGGTIGGSMVYDFGFNVEASTDSPVWHKSEKDVLHPKGEDQ